MKGTAFLLIVLIFSSHTLSTNSTATGQELLEFYSFENDSEGWTASGTDLDIGSGFIPWSIARSQERAEDGNTAFKLDLASLNSRGKIWIERQFIAEPRRIYQVSIEYALASTGGDLGAYTMITGVLTKRPETRTDLIPAYKDLASNENSLPGVYSWAKRKYEFTVRTGDEGTLYAVIGMWGTSGLHHIVFVDSVRVTLSLKEECEFYSFENDLEGWTTNSIDLGGGSEEWSIGRSQEVWEDGNSSVKFDLNNFNDNAKVWIERAFPVEPQNKYKVSLEYAFRSRDIGDIPGFRIIAGVFRNRPEAGGDLEPAFQEKTTSTHGTWGWLHKSYEFTVKSKKKNALYVIIGVLRTHPAPRNYWVDSVCVTLTKK